MVLAHSINTHTHTPKLLSLKSKISYPELDATAEARSLKRCEGRNYGPIDLHGPTDGRTDTPSYTATKRVGEATFQSQKEA